MDAQILMLYILILLNQVIAYGALFYLATGALGKEKNVNHCKVTAEKEKPQKKQQVEEPVDKSGKYLDYINKFEVEA